MDAASQGAPPSQVASAVSPACPRCHAANARDASFCSHCGAGLTPLDGPHAHAAPQPGAPLVSGAAALAGERKHVTVMFCDIVQSAALVQRLGAEDYRELIGAFFALALSVVHRYCGTINQYLGDGFMSLFGAPIAHEDHVRLAVLAALELRDRLAAAADLHDIQLRIGISTGTVVVGRIADDARMDYTAFGDTTVIASRLQALARPGEILLGATVAERVRGYVELESTEVMDTKDGPIAATRAVTIGARRSRLEDPGRTLTPFTGRADELAALHEALQAAVGGNGAVVDIAGEAGLGKSRLLLEFRHLVSGARVCEGRCVSYGSAMAYYPIIELLRQTCRILAADARGTIADKLRDTLARTGLPVDPALPFLRDLLGLGAGDEPAPLDPASVKGRTFELLSMLWRRESEHQPLVLIVEDLHWLDRTSEQFLASFVETVRGNRILLLTSYRTGYAPPWAGQPASAQVLLQPLSEATSRTIVGASLARDADAALTASIVHRGEGNPLFLEELAQSASHGRPASDPRVPQTVQEVLAARIDALEPQPKHALQVAAVLGREFSLGLLQAVYDGRSRLDVHLADLCQRKLVFEQAHDGDPTYVFKHALTQEVAYASLLEKRRRELHGRIARQIETLYGDNLDERCELLAYHYGRSNDPAKAADYLILANRRAAARNAMEEAVGYFYEALRVLEALPDTRENRKRRLRLVFDQTGEFHFLHRHQEYHDLILRHRALAVEVDDPELLGAFHARLGHRQWTSNRIVESIATLEAAARLCERSGNAADHATAEAILEWAHLMLGNYDRVLFHRDRVLEQMERRFMPVWYSFCRAAAVMAYGFTGRWDDALREANAAIEEGRSRSDRAIVSFNAGMASNALLFMRHWAGAREYALLALREAPTVYFEAFPQAFLARAQCATGGMAQGMPMLIHLEALLDASGHRPAWALIALHLADAQLANGDLEGAERVLHRVADAAGAANEAFLNAQSVRLLAEIDMAQGRDRDAAQRLDCSIEISRRTGQRNELALALADYARLRRRTEDRVTARVYASEALDLLIQLGTLEETARVRDEMRALPA